MQELLIKGLDSGPISIIITDTQANIVYVNKKFEELTGYTLNEIKDENPRILKSGYFSTEDYGKLWNTLTSGKTWSGEMQNKKKDGTIYWEEVSIAPILENNNITGYIGYKKDISSDKQKEEELKAANIEQSESLLHLNQLAFKLQDSERELKQLNATKDKFFSIISHDLKNPFGTIMNASKLLKTGYNELSQEQIERLIEMILTSSTKSYNLLESLLQWAKSQRGSIKTNPKPFNLKKLVSEVFKLLVLHAKNKEINLINNIDEDIEITADINMINTVIRNLCSNAIKFTKKNGYIKVNHKVINDSIIISISDNGIGMSNETKESLFKIDSYSSTKGTANETGTGLGLIICKEFTEANKGIISVESVQGKGSTFTITLPYNLKQEEKQKEESDKENVYKEFIHEIVNNQKLRNLFTAKIIDEAIKVEKAASVHAIKDFANELILIGETFKSNIVSSFAYELLDATNTYDFKKMLNMLKAFHEIS